MIQTEVFNINISKVKRDIQVGILECQKRGLNQSTKFLAELNHGLMAPPSTTNLNQPALNLNPYSGISELDLDNYLLARSFIDCREFERAAHFTQNCESPVPKFVHLYSSYMAKEKKKLDDMVDTSAVNGVNHVKDLSELLNILKSEYNEKNLDGYGLYLYGVVLKKLDLHQMAVQVFLESIHKEPILWASWLELSPLISDKDKLFSMNLPNHWMKYFFLAYTLLELFLNDEALKMYEDLKTTGFAKCLYIISQIAIAYCNKREVDKAIDIFKEILAVDPYRLDNLDIYSNLLFVKDQKQEIAVLAHRAAEINKYRPETCCVIGNYYGIRQDHQKAVIYFQRALKLNPRYLSAWTLMGHEFMEMKNTNAAIQSYRQAVEVNRRDFRAWYGLGQAYEILKMPFYSYYYYKTAQQLRPYDSRMLVALGEIYEKLHKEQNALKCYDCAHKVGDIEGNAILKKAQLHLKLEEKQNAFDSFLIFLSDERSVNDKSALCTALMYVANYYFSPLENLDEAAFFANRCLEYEDSKVEAQGLLSQIANIRDQNAKKAKQTGGVVSSNDTVVSEVNMDESSMIIEDMDEGSSVPTNAQMSDIGDQIADDNNSMLDLMSFQDEQER
uniref:CSON011203 protein n=1 Tax=Culicoides sonorensis TaxID=179676 RepID=A0A336MGN3_CULSO